MQVGFLVTNGGPHSAADWAAVTAGQIIQIAQNADGPHVAAARRLELQIMDLLEAHHDEVQQEERAKLIEHGPARLTHLLSEDEHLCHCTDCAVRDIVEAAEGTPFAEHFGKPGTQDYLRTLVANHFATSAHVERSWHADRNPESEEAKLFRATAALAS